MRIDFELEQHFGQLMNHSIGGIGTRLVYAAVLESGGVGQQILDVPGQLKLLYPLWHRSVLRSL